MEYIIKQRKKMVNYIRRLRQIKLLSDLWNISSNIYLGNINAPSGLQVGNIIMRKSNHAL